MSTGATLNVRMAGDLKRNGDRVLERAGVSVSDAVRGLYQYLEREQAVPSWLAPAEEEDAFEKRRRLLRDVVGIAPVPSDFTRDDIKRGRLGRYFRDGDAS